MTDNITLEEVKDKWFTALQSDLEHGVAWMNEDASREQVSFRSCRCLCLR